MKKTFQFLNQSMKTGLLLLCFIPLLVFSETPEWQWAKQAGGNNFNSGKDIVTDEYGNFYVTGFFQGTATFGEHTITTEGGFDMFVVKYDSEGEALWAAGMGSIFLDYGISLAVDADQNVYVTGYFGETMDTDVGPITPVGLRDVFLAKYNADGQLAWVRSAGGPGLDHGDGVAVDNSLQRVYISGSFQDSMAFSGSMITLTGAGNEDIFVAAYDFDGNLIWARAASGPGNNRAFSLDTDADGNIYGGGGFSETITFGDIQLSTMGMSNIVVFKLDPDGNWLWANAYGGNLSETIWDLQTHPNGDTWFTGVFSSMSVSFGDHTIGGDGMYYSIYVVKQDADGVVQWASSGGSSIHDYGRGIAVDGQGNSFITGNFHLTATFDDLSITAGDNTDAYVVKYSPQGDALWAVGAGGISTDVGEAIAADAMGNVYLTGYFYNDISFGDITLNTISMQDIFIAKLNDGTSESPELTVTISVADQQGMPVAGAMITIYADDAQNAEEALTLITDEDGQAVFMAAPGNYDMVIEKDCFFDHESQFVVAGTDIVIDIELEALAGDANGDGIVNVLDVNMLVNYYVGNDSSGLCFNNADVNGDDVINVMDIISIVTIFSSGR
jgi:hypothetical protein